jgi:hypothetical protein
MKKFFSKVAKFFGAVWGLVKKIPIGVWLLLVGAGVVFKFFGGGLGKGLMALTGRGKQQPAVSGRSRDELNAAAKKVDKEVAVAEDRVDAEVRKEDDAIDDLFGGDP